MNLDFSRRTAEKKIMNEYKNLKKQEIQNIFIKTNYKKSCFQYDMAYGGCKDLSGRATSNKLLCDKSFILL